MNIDQHNDEIRRRMQDVADRVNERFPADTGFIILAAPFGDNPKGRLQYVSNIQRKEAICLLKEWLIKASAEEDWMKDLE